MSVRKTVSGRPSGTDGSDFSYRMVVDSRYQKVAQGKSRLSAVILTQALVQFLAVVALYLSVPKWFAMDRVSLYSGVAYFLSLVLGEFGRRRSRVTLLKFYLFGSSVSTVASGSGLLMSGKPLEYLMEYYKEHKPVHKHLDVKLILKDVSEFDLSSVEVVVVLLGAFVQIVAIGVTMSLVRNMAPPKRTS